MREYFQGTPAQDSEVAANDGSFHPALGFKSGPDHYRLRPDQSIVRAD